MIGVSISGNANNTTNTTAQRDQTLRGSTQDLQNTLKNLDKTGSSETQQSPAMMHHYPTSESGKDIYSGNSVAQNNFKTQKLEPSSSLTSSTAANNLVDSSTTASTTTAASQNIKTSLIGNKSKRIVEEKLQFNSTTIQTKANATDGSGLTIEGLGTGEDTSTSTSKKPQFQFVCMEPTKDQRQEKSIKTSNQPKPDKSANLIDPATLSRIIRLQKHQQFLLKSGGNLSTSAYFGNSQSLMTGSSSSGVHQRLIYSDKSNDFQNFGGGFGNFKDRPMRLDIDKIGICGIPSLWVSRDELISQGHLFKEQLEEQERMERLLRILHCHKKYENDKYFGGSIFKRTNQATGGVSTSGFTSAIMNGVGLMNHQGNQQSTVSLNTAGQGVTTAEYIWFSIENLAKLKLNSHTVASLNDDKDSFGSTTLQPLPQIRTFDQSEALTFKILQAEAKLIRLVLESHGFVQTDQNDWNLLWTCTSSLQKQYIYESLQEYQRINHFLNAAELTRKDRLCYNVGKMQQKFGKDHFDFLPETYILPDEYPEFQKQFQARAQQIREHNNNGGGSEGENTARNLWIVKPASSSQGKGIFMIDELSELQMNESQVISRYIDNPLLINGLKFDLRLYVLVTNFDPLKIYIYNEGLVRFASEPYNLETIKSNVYAHLTNYSINKKSENFVQNKNLTERDFGNKWSLSALQTHLERLGIDMKAVWQRIYDSIIKSLISVEAQVVSAIKRVQNASGGSIKSNCFDLFGFDIILDQDLKPWILEVNLSPSLAFDSPLDFHIKSNLIIDALNVVGIRKFNRNKEGKRGVPNGGAKPVKLIQNNPPQNQQQPSQQQSATKNEANKEEQRKRLSAHSSTMANMQSQSQLAKIDNHSLERHPPNHLSNHQTTSNLFSNVNIDIIHMERLSKISAKHRELLREHLEEFCLLRSFFSPSHPPPLSQKLRRHNFTRIYPSPGTNQYDLYFPSDPSQNSSASTTHHQQPQKQYNKILYRYLYDKSSELQDILNQIIKQNEMLLMSESQKRASQQQQQAASRMRDNSAAVMRTKEELSESLERIQRGEYYEKSPAGGGEVGGGGGGEGGQQTMGNGVRHQVVITSIAAVEQAAGMTASGFNKQYPRSQSSVANNKAESEIIESIATQQNLKTIVNNTSQLGSFSPNKENKRTAAGFIGTQINEISLASPSKQFESSQSNNQQYMMNNNNMGSAPSNDLSPLKFIQGSQASIQTIEPFSTSIQVSSKLTTNSTKEMKQTPSDGSSRKTNYLEGYNTQISSGSAPAGDGRIIVTGDDILIEYVRRIMNLIKQCFQSGIDVSGVVSRKLDLFIGHKIWQPKEERNKQQQAQGGVLQSSTSSGALNNQQQPSIPMWQRIEKRFFEMGERKRRLFIKKHQQQQQNQDTRKSSESLEKMFKAQEKQKADIVKDFSSNELELMLMQSNKNNPIEVVTLLLTLNPAMIGGTGTSSNTSNSIIYNSLSQQTSFGGVLTKLESEAASKVRANDTHHNHMMINEKSFDNNYLTQKASNPASILSQLRSSEENITTAALPTSSHSSKKDPFSSTLGSQNLESMKHTQYQQPQGSSNPNIMNNFANANIGNTNLKSSASKGKNQGSFDRSDIAMQTGLALTQQQNHSNKLGSILLQNQQDKNQLLKFPQINNSQLASATVTSTAGFHQYHSNNGGAAGYGTNAGGQTNPSYLNYSTQKPMGIHSYLAQQQHQMMGGPGKHPLPSTIQAGNPNGNEATSKYRINKITNNHTVSMSPGGMLEGGNSTSGKYQMNKNLRGPAATNNGHTLGNEM